MLIVAMLFSIPALAASKRAKKVASIAAKQLGKPYRLSSDPPSSFNCSSLVRYCYNRVRPGTVTKNGINVRYKRIHSKNKLKVGDIVIFKNSSGVRPKILNYHFGIYCGKGYFIHASQAAGKVKCSKVKKYSGHWVGAIRIF